MDWPLAGILTGIVVFTGAAAYGVVGIIQSDAPLPHKASKSAEPTLVPKSALPVFVAPNGPREQVGDTTPLISLSNPPGPFEIRQDATTPGARTSLALAPHKGGTPNVASFGSL